MVLYLRISDLLAKAGHQVTLYRPHFDTQVRKMKSTSSKDVFAQGISREDWNYQETLQKKSSFKDIGFFGKEMQASFSNAGRLVGLGCEAQLNDSKLIEQLKAENFDIAFGNMYEMCSFGLMKLMNISSYGWLLSSVLVEHPAMLMGVPTPPSYVPGTFTEFNDHMSYYERLRNFIGAIVFSLYYPNMIKPQQEAFYKQHGKDFPNLMDLAAKSQLVFVNSEELLDFPRPILHKTIYYAGIGMKQSQKLNKEWSAVMERGKEGVILMSFGSFVAGSAMPIEWKIAFLKSFANFPNHQFILKYEDKDIENLPEAKSLNNLLISSWVPQTDILAHPKTVAFITHAGFNSLLETANAGVPIVCVPLFGDQFRNCKVAQRHKFGVKISKTDAVDSNAITKTLKKIIQDKSYDENAKKLSRMMKKKPVKGEELIVKWTEFLAEFKQIPNLQPVGAELGFIQYHCLDVIGGLLIVILLTFYFIYKIFITISGLLCGKGGKTKKD